MESKNQKPRKPRKKKLLPVEEIDDQLVDEDSLDPAFEDALTSFLKKHAHKKGKSLKNTKSLEHLLQQYLNSYILIGYSHDTREFISMVNANDEQSADSLSAALHKFISNNTTPKPGSYPPVI